MGIVIIIGLIGLVATGIIYRYVTHQTKEQQVGITKKIGTTGTRQQPEKDIQQFTQQQLEEVTGLLFKQTTVDQLYDALNQPLVWEKLGYSTPVAEQIVDRFVESQEQAKSILQELVTDETNALKIIVITKQKEVNVSIGTALSVTESIQGQSNDSTAKQESATPLQNISKLKIKIKDGKEQIKISYKVKSDQSESIVYENTATNESYNGEKAKQQLLVLLRGITIQTGNESEIEQKLVDVLELSVPIKEFSFEAETTSGDQIEFKQKEKS